MHLLAKFKPDKPLTDTMRRIKSNSSRWINEEVDKIGKFSWQAGYGAFSVGGDQVAALGEYIKGQSDHHRRVSFQEEFLAFLEANGVAYDERYIWRP